jgi:hypothetical protein
MITYEGNSLNERLDAAPSSFAEARLRENHTMDKIALTASHPARVLSKRSMPDASHILLTQAAYARHR